MSSIAKPSLAIFAALFAALLAALLGTLATFGSQADAGPRPVAVRIVDLAFVPQVVHARVGQRIVWTNEDQVAHMVTSGTSVDTNLWTSSEPLGEGRSFSLVLDRPGTYAYFCKPHFYDAAMHGRIVVTAPETDAR